MGLFAHAETTKNMGVSMLSVVHHSFVLDPAMSASEAGSETVSKAGPNSIETTTESSKFRNKDET